MNTNEIYELFKAQCDTVAQLNALTPERTGRVHADPVNALAHFPCGTDSAHGPGTIRVTIDGDGFDECRDCGIDVVRMIVEHTTGEDHIDVEVYL